MPFVGLFEVSLSWWTPSWEGLLKCFPMLFFFFLSVCLKLVYIGGHLNGKDSSPCGWVRFLVFLFLSHLMSWEEYAI